MKTIVFLSTLPDFIMYFLLSITLTGLFMLIYMKITPYDELGLIRKGNIAPAISLGGSLLGFVAAVSSVIIHSINLIDLIMWGIVAAVIQLIAYAAVCMLIRDIIKGIEEGIVAHGIFMGFISFSMGILNGACMTP